MKLNIRNTSWFKRRDPHEAHKEIQPVLAIVPDDMKLENNHMCKMLVYYDDDNGYLLSARVNQNPITGNWTIHGINHNGLSTLADIEI